MKKTVLLFTALIVFSSFCFAVPNPGGKASIRNGLPPGVTPPPPTTIHKTSNIAKPLPTNKWFTSVLHNPYHSYSLKMFTYPQNFECAPDVEHSKGLVISYPKVRYSADVISYGYSVDTTYNYKYPNNIKISEYSEIANNKFVDFDSAKLDKYSDFAATAKWEESNYWLKATFGQGMVFSYFECDSSGYPTIEFPYDWEQNGKIYLYKPNSTTPIEYALDIDTGGSDRIILETRFPDNRSVFYGIYVSSGTTFKQCSWSDNFNRIFMVLPNDKRYFSVGLLPSADINEAIADLELYYNYAYNFVTDTKVNWEVSSSDYSSKSTFNITTTKMRSDIDQQEGTLFCLYPHQYNNLSSSIDYVENKTFDTLRGNLKLAKGNTFSVKTKFNGIVPFFQYDVKNIKTTLSEYLEIDNRETPVNSVPTNTYHGGKVLAKLANMLPIADNLKDETIKKSIIIKLKNLLGEQWFKYTNQNEKYFAYDDIWGGLIGIDNSYGSEQYNDHHFHYGYFIYTAAILAMYDDTFAQDYGGMVELLIKDIANTKRNDSDFPFMRCFDFYESHSWANGMGGQDNRGIDQESSSEAMNAWAAIYLWGLATKNDEYKNLGIYLYSSEYEAIKYYYFDIDGEIFKSPYNHNSVGIVWGGQVVYNLHFDPRVPQTIKGIQILPMTPSMTYLVYDRNYIEDFYNSCKTENGGDMTSQWYDIWTRLIALYNPIEALSNFDRYKTVTAEEGSSMSFTYHFIHFFDEYGTPIFTHTADTSSYMVLEKNDGTKTYCAYNSDNRSKNVEFYGPSGESLGYLYVPRRSFALSQKLSEKITVDKILVYPVPYKPNSNGRYGGDGIYFSNVNEGTDIQIFNIAGEKVFDKTVDDDSGEFLWNAKNNAGNDIASGVYFYYIKTLDGKKVKGKLAIER